MFERVKVIIFLCLALSLEAKPRLLNEKSGRTFHFTNIGDILSKDIVQLAESTSPNSDTFNAEETDDPYDNNIEAETTAYSKTVPIGDSPDLASPRDQEEKFVNILQKHYKGTFPEYGKETKADFSKNKELEDNLSAQPETVYFGHSDKYQGKNDNVNDYPIMDETAGGLDNLAAFDADTNVLNSLKLTSTTITPHAHRKQHKTQSIEDILSEYGENVDNIADDGQTGIGTAVTTEDYEGHKSVLENDDGNMDVNEKPGNENKHLTHHVTDHVTESMDDKMMGSTNEHVTDNETDKMEDHVTEHEASHMTDNMDNHVTDHKSDNMDDGSSEKLKKLREKTEEEALWDSEEKLRQKLARKKKQKSLAKEKHPTKKKEKLKDLSEEILKDFDELKKHNTKTSEKPHHKIQDSKTDKPAKHIKYVHADESQVTGDAILDFLDKLLEKDPKELRHDVLAMTKEMQKEGKPKSDSSEKSKTAEKAVSSSYSSSTVEDKPQVARESTKASKKPDEVDDWISQLENDIDVENQDKGKQKDMGEENKGTNEDYYDEEYDQFHDGEESIDPDGGQSAEHKMNEQKDKEVKNKKKIKKKQDDHFDYEEFKEEALKMHNEYRRRHNAVALTWSESLAKKAHTLASKLLEATRTNFKRELEKQGENIAILPYSTKDIAKQAVEKWYAEITKFSFTSPSIKPETRDFTQIIWKNSKEIGMGFVHTPDKKKTLVIALYSPTGNDENKLRENLNTVHDDPYADIKRYFLSRP